jgi:hypothetical protein
MPVDWKRTGKLLKRKTHLKCSYIKSNGERCRAYAQKYDDYCIFHDPTLKDERVFWTTRGGKRSGITRRSKL